MVYGSPFVLSTHPTPTDSGIDSGFSPRNYNTLGTPPRQCLSLGERMQLMLSMCLFLSTRLCRKHDVFVPLCYQSRPHHSNPSYPSSVYGDLGVFNIVSDPLVL